MAQELVPRLWDDYDLAEQGLRREASVTEHIGIDGAWYQLDLSDEHAKPLREMLERAKAAGLKLDGPPPRPKKGRKPGQLRPGSKDGERLRNWADANGLSDEYRKKASGDGYYYSSKLRNAYAEVTG
jgi:hypothetical protein